MDPEVVADRFFSEYLGADLSRVAEGEPCLAVSPRRGRPEMGYGYTALVWMLLTRGRMAVSVHPAVEGLVADWLRHLRSPCAAPASEAMEKLARACNSQSDVPIPDRVRVGPESSVAVCGPSTLRTVHLQEVRRVLHWDLPALSRAGLYDDSLDASIEEGTCFMTLADGEPVSLSGTHRVPHMADEVSDLNIPGTLAAHRRKGHGSTCASATTRAVVELGRIGVWGSSPDNAASLATRRALGYSDYARGFKIIAQRNSRFWAESAE